MRLVTIYVRVRKLVQLDLQKITRFEALYCKSLDVHVVCRYGNSQRLGLLETCSEPYSLDSIASWPSRTIVEHRSSDFESNSFVSHSH